jgi:hypothetical protein
MGSAEQADGAVDVAGLGAVAEDAGEGLLGGGVAEGEDEGVAGAEGRLEAFEDGVRGGARLEELAVLVGEVEEAAPGLAEAGD